MQNLVNGQQHMNVSSSTITLVTQNTSKYQHGTLQELFWVYPLPFDQLRGSGYAIPGLTTPQSKKEETLPRLYRLSPPPAPPGARHQRRRTDRIRPVETRSEHARGTPGGSSGTLPCTWLAPPGRHARLRR